MRTLNLKIPTADVPIRIQHGGLDHIGEWLCKPATPPVVAVCTDSNVARWYADQVLASIRAAGPCTDLIIFPPGDPSKTLSQLDSLYGRLAEAGITRDGMILALGGGAVSDLVGFAAATWMRGIRFAIAPTTLEADLDAAVGGKTAINHPRGKNLIGAFYHPEIVVIDPTCLSTLPRRDVSAGLAESIKHALIRDPEFLTWHEDNADAIQSLENEVIGQLIERNLQIKIAIVQSDERETGDRALLNFGHTIGHAVEQWFEYALRHGEAVALGMLAATRISSWTGLITEDDVERITRVLHRFDLPTHVPHPMNVQEIEALTRIDKKVATSRRRWILLESIGRAVIRTDLSDEVIRQAIESLNP